MVISKLKKDMAALKQMVISPDVFVIFRLWSGEFLTYHALLLVIILGCGIIKG